MSWFLTIFFTILTISHLSEARVHEKKLQPAVVVGTVFCDTCFQEDFTKTSHFISGAMVAVECKYERSSKPVFREEAKTDRRGEFKVHLPFSVSKHVKKIEECSVKLISSSEPYCGVASTATSTMLHLKSREQGTHIFSAGFFTFKPLKQPTLCNQKPSIQNPNDELHWNNPDLSFPPPLQDPNTPNDLPPLPGLPQLPPLPNLPQLPPLPNIPPFPNFPPLQNPTKSSVPSHHQQTKQNLLPQQKPTKSSFLSHDQQTKHTPQTFFHDQELNEGRVAEQDFFFPPNPFQPPPLIPNPFQPPPLIPNPFQPPPLIPNPFQPPPAPLIPNPFQPPPAPLIPNPFQPPPAPTPLIPNPFQPPPAPTPLIPNPFQPPPAPTPLIPNPFQPPPAPAPAPLWPFPPLIPGLIPSPPPPPPPIFPFPFPPIFPIPPPRSPGAPPS